MLPFVTSSTTGVLQTPEAGQQQQQQQQQRQGASANATHQQQAQEQQQGQMQFLPCLARLCITNPDDEDEFTIAPAGTPGLYGLTNLRNLQLHDIDHVEEPEKLSCILRLETLVLLRTNPGCADDHCRHVYGPSNADLVVDAAELLPLLGKLPKLRHLQVCPMALCVFVSQWTALKLATSFEVLRLQCVFMHKDAWPLVFQSAQLPRLRELRFTGNSLGMAGSPGMRCNPMPAQCKQQLVTACPNLVVLELGGLGLLREAPLALLSQFQKLTSLQVVCERADAVQALAQLTRLRDLHVHGEVSDVHMLMLMGLTRLTRFERERWVSDHDSSLDTDGVCFKYQVGGQGLWLPACLCDSERPSPVTHQLLLLVAWCRQRHRVRV
jgi:hypothetical protein